MTTRRPWGAGTVVQRGKDTWQIRWSVGTDPFTGKHRREAVTLRGVTKTQAIAELQRRQAARRVSTRMTLGELLDVTLPRLDVTTATNERYGFALKMIPEGARAWPVADITVPAAGDLFARLAEMHGAASVRKCHTAIMACWKEAYRVGWVARDANPFAGIKLPKVSRSAGKLLDPEQVRALLAVAEPGQEHAWIMVHIVTGARPGEVRQLRWSQIDLDGAVIRFVDDKHGGEERPVAITQALVEVLADWRAEQAATQPVGADCCLFSTEADASVPWRKEYVRTRWNTIRAKAGLPSTLRLYDVRHTINSLLADADIPAHVRGLRAGNSAAVNESVYTHRATAQDRAAAEVIGRVLE